MGPLPSTVISLLFLAVGIIVVQTMLNVQGRTVSSRERWVRIHRWTGYLFLSLFMLMFISMIWRVEEFWEPSSPRATMHVTLAVWLFMLLITKVLIARYYRRLLTHLVDLGLAAYLLSFTMVMIVAGYYLVWTLLDKPYISHDVKSDILDLDLGKQLFIQRCSTCHVLQEIMRPRTENDWEGVVNRMVELARPRIKPDEAIQIMNYLIIHHSPKALAPPSDDASLVERHCLGCHKATEIFNKDRTTQEWRLIVEQMSQMAPEQVPAKQIEAILRELVADERSHYLPPLPGPMPGPGR